MRIAFILAEYPVLSETFVIRQIAGLVGKGHNVTVIAGISDDTLPDPLDGQIDLKRIRAHGNGAQMAKVFSGALAIARAPTQFKALRKAIGSGLLSSVADAIFRGDDYLGSFDAVVAHFGPSGVRAMYLREMGCIAGPIATVFHGFDMSQRDFLKKYLPHYKKLFRQTEALLPISVLWKERLIKWGAPERKVEVVRMGIDIDRLARRDSTPRPQGPLRIMTTARFVEKKGLEYAIKGVCGAKSNVHLSIIGYGPLEDRLRALAEICPDRISFLGKCSHAEVLEHLEHADVFLLPSVTAANGSMEGIPVSLMEAMAAGVTVIATTHSGIPELIDSGSEGILVPERDADGISKALDAIVDGRYDLPKMGEAARSKVQALFENRKLDDQFERTLLALAGKRTG